MKFDHFDLHFSHEHGQPTAMSVETLLAEYADGRRRFDNIDLREANLDRAKLPMISLEESILQNAKLSGANLAGATLNHVDFSFAILTNANFIAADLVRAKLIGAKLTGAVMSGANLSGASFRKADLTNCIFAGANLSGVDFSGAILRNTNFGGANLKGANLRDVDLTEVDLTDLDLTETILPEGLAGEHWGHANRDFSLPFDEVVPGWGRTVEAFTPEPQSSQTEAPQSKMIASETGLYLNSQNQPDNLETEAQPTEYLDHRSPFDLDIPFSEIPNGGDVIGTDGPEEYITKEYVTEEYTEEYTAEPYVGEYAPEPYVGEYIGEYAPEQYAPEQYAPEQYAPEQYTEAYGEEYVTEGYITEEYATEAYAPEASTEAFTEMPVTEEYLDDDVTEALTTPEEYVTGVDLGVHDAAGEETGEEADVAVSPSPLEAEDRVALDAADGQWSEPMVAEDEEDLYLNALDALDAIAMEEHGAVSYVDADLPQPPAMVGEASPTISFSEEPINPFSLTHPDDGLLDLTSTETSDHPENPFSLGSLPLTLQEDSYLAPTEGETANASDLTEPVDWAVSEATPKDSPDMPVSPETTGLTAPVEEDSGQPEEETQFLLAEEQGAAPTADSSAMQGASVVSPGESPATPYPVPTDVPARDHPTTSAMPGSRAPNALNSRVVHSIQAALGRRVQYSLQRKLLDIYHEKCAITGCDIQPLLATVFITSHDRDRADHPSQCLVLREDLKTLYDLKLLAIHPQHLTVLLSPQLIESSYGHFQGQTITIPEQKIYHPSPDSLAQHLQDCTWYNQGYQSKPQPSASAIFTPHRNSAQRWLSLPSLVALGIGVIAGAGLMWPLRGAFMGQPPALEADPPPAQLNPQAQNRIHIQAGDLRYNQQGVIVDQSAYIALNRVQQFGLLNLLNGAVPEDVQQQIQGETYVRLSYLATLGIPVTWDADSRTAILDCCQSQMVEPISLVVNNRNWPAAGMIVDNRAYVPQSKLTELNLDLDALNPAHSIDYQNETYVRASDLKDLSAVVDWDADARVLSIRD